MNRIVSFLILSFVFLIPFEQSLFFFFEIDTIFKPYRIFLFLAFFISLFSNFSFYKKIDTELYYFLSIFFLGFANAILRISFFEGSVSLMNNSIQHFLIGLLICHLFLKINDVKFIEKIIKTFFLGIILSLIYFSIYTNFFTENILYRMSGFFNNPNHLAMSINFISISLAFKLFRKFSFVNLFIILFFTYILVLTGSRTGLLLQAFIFLFLILRNQDVSFLQKLTFIMTLIIAFQFISEYFFFSEQIISRFSSSSNISSGAGRTDIMLSSLNVAIDNFFIGIGIGQYPYYHLDYIAYDSYETIKDYQLGTHNHYLDLLVNFGFVAFFIFLSLLIKINRRIRSISNYSFKIELTLLFYLLLIMSFSQEMFSFPVFWVIISIIISYSKISSNEFQ